MCISALLVCASGAPQFLGRPSGQLGVGQAGQFLRGIRPAGQTSHQSVIKADGEVRSSQVTIKIINFFFKIVGKSK